MFNFFSKTEAGRQMSQEEVALPYEYVIEEIKHCKL
jgi:hypothetical protein